MNQERILSTLYDMALVISAKVRLQPLLDNTLKRLIYHTGYPVGLFLLNMEDNAGGRNKRYRLCSAIGDHRLMPYLNHDLTLPAELDGKQAEELSIDPQMLDSLPVRGQYYHCALRLPVPGEGVIILLSPVASNPDIPFSTIFQPIMANLANAIQLCRTNESFTKALIRDRDEALIANERFRSAMDTSSDCIFLIDPEKMLFIDFNRTAESVLGYSREELSRLGPHEIKPKLSREELQSFFHSIMQRPGGVNELVTVHRCKDGRTFPVETRLSVLVQKEHPPLIISVDRDVTERKNIETRLYEEKERAQVTLRSIGDAVITTDTSGRIEFMNPIAEQLTEWRIQDAIGEPLQHVFRIINESSRVAVRNPVEFCLSEKRIIGLDSHTLLISRTGKEIAIEDSAAPIRNAKGKITGAVLVFHDVSETRGLADELSWNATHDPLTELINRHEFEHRLEMAFIDAQQKQHTHSLLYIDLDHFKLINDTSGHIAGDNLLHQLSTKLIEQVRGVDTLARLGGDEFGLLLINIDVSGAQRIAAKVQAAIDKFEFTWDNKTFKVSASIGIVEINRNVESGAQIMSHADMACYAAKEAGGNRIHVYQPDDTELAQRKGEMRWVSQINHALENDRFTLFAQPIVPINSHSKRNHYELLLRILDEGGKLVLPGNFIPAAERYKLMYQVDRWVIHHALEYYCKHREQLGDTLLTLNLSGFSLTQDSLVDYILEEFESHNANPENFCFEITETEAISNLGRAHDVIQELRRSGSSFALDDFGSGLSSFNYLKNLPVDYLKIDGSFVKEILDDPVYASMVDAINKIGHEMGLETIAEYVENPAVMEKLREIGVDYAQGNGVGLPVPLTDL
ncbi:MAG: EAL domain-containing protein [Pseudomonadota bacterium]